MLYARVPMLRPLVGAVLGVSVGLVTSGCGMIAPEDADASVVDVDAGGVTPPEDATIDSAADAGTSDATLSDATLTNGADDSGAPDATLSVDSGRDARDLDADAGDAALPLDAGDAADAADAGLPSGVLDTTFAGTGYVTRSGTAGPVNGPADDIGYGIAVDSLGRVLVTGGSHGTVYYRAFVSRLDGAGAFDVTFGSAGAWLSPVQVGDAFGLGVASDGADRPLITGSGWRSDSGVEAMSTWRLTTDGVPDTSFNGTGQAFAITDAGASLGTAITRDEAGGPIVVGLGNASGGPAGSKAMAMASRLTTAGASDTSFGSPNGFVFSSGPDGGNGGDRGKAVALDRSGNVVAGGYIFDGTGTTYAALWRFTSSGALDTSFGGTGSVTFQNLGGPTTINQDMVNGVAIDAQNGILFCGTTRGGATPEPRGFVARLTGAGALDTGFGQGGIVVFDPHTDNWGTLTYGMTVDSQGRILAVGAVGGPGDIATVWRLTSTGAPDTSYGSLGEAHVPVPGFVNTLGYAVAVDQNDRAVVTGFSAQYGNNYHDLLVFRLTP